MLPSGHGLPFTIAAPGGGIAVSELTGYYEYSRVLVRIRPGQQPGTQALALPDRRTNIDALAAGSSGTVWFTDFGTSQVGSRAVRSGRRQGAPRLGLESVQAPLPLPGARRCECEPAEQVS